MHEIHDHDIEKEKFDSEAHSVKNPKNGLFDLKKFNSDGLKKN